MRDARRTRLFHVIGAVGLLAVSAPIAHAQDVGTSGAACYGNGTCNTGLTCDAGVCVAPQAGQVGGACYGNGTCNAGMTCDAATQSCVAAGTAPVGAAPVGGGMLPATTDTSPATGAIDGMKPAAAPPALPAADVTAEAVPAPSDKRWWIGAKGGFLMGGTVDIDGTEYDSDSGVMIHATVDGVVAPRFCIGGFLLYASSGLEGEVDAHVTTVGGTLKGRFPAGKVEVRPGLAIGYQIIGGEAFEGADDSQGLDVGGLVGLAVPLSPKTDFLGEIGFISQPSGGNENADISFGPIFYIAAGASFGG